MSINGFNPNLLMGNMMPMQGLNSVQNPPVNLLANTGQLANQSALGGAALDTSNPMNALGQLFSMLTTLLTQLFGGAGGTGNTGNTGLPGQNMNQQPSYAPPATNQQNNGNQGLGSLATMLQELIRNLSGGQPANGTGGNAPAPKNEADATPTNKANNKPADKTNTPQPSKVTNTNNTGDGSVVTNTSNEAGRDIKNYTKTVSDSNNTYNINIQVEPKNEGYGTPPAADQGPPPTHTKSKPGGGGGDINNNTTNINNGKGDINNNTTNINGGKGNINNNDTNINNGKGTINNNTTNINGGEDCPPPAEDCPPPAKPPKYEDNNDSKYYGDPHFVGFGGEIYDVMGEPGKIYNILSDKDLQYNAEFAAWGKPGADGVQPTVINKGGVTSGKDQVTYELNGTPKVNGKEMEVGKEYKLDANGKAKWDGSLMHFENSEYSIDLGKDPQNKDAILSNVKVREGVNPLADGVKPHGLLGQTADGVKGEKVGKNADGSEKTDKSNKQGGTVIDGDHTDYQVASLLDTSFTKHNQFSA